MIRLNSKQLREVDPQEVQIHAKEMHRNPIYLILENVYDTYNIGGLFRLADALAVEKVFLCGEMDIPPHHKIAKASVGTYKIVPWVYKVTAKEAIEELRKQYNTSQADRDAKKKLESDKYNDKGIQILAIEQSSNSVPYTQTEFNFPVALLVGNETYGVLEETMALVDQIVEIPMWGINKSLNVIVSAAIVSYYVASQLKK